MNQLTISLRFVGFWLLLGLVFPGTISAVEQPVKVALIADRSQVVPGENIRVGVRFKIPQPFHVYWKEPGDAGLPTRITWGESTGVTVGELKWPTHKEFDQALGIKGLGYEDEVLLFAPAQIDPAAAVGSKAVVRATVDWLSCSVKICIRGSEKLVVELPVGDHAIPMEVETFDAWSKKLPKE